MICIRYFALLVFAILWAAVHHSGVDGICTGTGDDSCTYGDGSGSAAPASALLFYSPAISIHAVTGLWTPACGECSATGQISGCNQPGTVHMTIDDGPFENTPLTLDILKWKGFV